MKHTPEQPKKTTSKPEARFNKETLEHYQELLDSPDLIGVAFFLKEVGQVVVLGDMAGCGIAGSGDTVYEAIDTLDTISRIQDNEIAKKFGAEVVSLPANDEELISKTAAVESLRTELKKQSGIVDVRSTPTSIAVIVSGDGVFDGPWEWEGYKVYAEVEGGV